MKKPTVTVAIPAYNEEQSIVKILDSVYRQKRKNYRLADVIVYSDGSTDNTVSLIKSHFKDVKVIDSKVNIGKNKRINQIMKENSSDILIQADADVRLANNFVFDNLVAPLGKNSNVGISCAYHLASKPKYFIERLAYFGFKVWDNARNSLGRRGIRYYCEGGLRAFSKRYANEFRIPETINVSEDSYSFYWAITKGYKVEVNRKANIYIDLPVNFHDYSKQMRRFLAYTDGLANMFNGETLKKYQLITPQIKLKALVSEMIQDPVAGIGYVFLQAIVYIQMLSYKPSVAWTSIERKHD